jgi:hypothetical protein
MTIRTVLRSRCSCPSRIACSTSPRREVAFLEPLLGVASPVKALDAHRGSTLIKKGITSSMSKATPDVPFRLFELTLPEGRYSALAANGNTCRARLTMPTVFVAQNGVGLRINSIMASSRPAPGLQAGTSSLPTRSHRSLP